MADDMIEVLGGKLTIPQREVALLMEAGYLLMELDKYAEAEEVFQGVASLLPHSDVPHLALGNMYFSQGRWAQALKSHRQALKLNDKSALAHAHIGEVLLFQRKQDEALVELNKALEFDADGPAGALAKSLLEATEVGVFDHV